MLFSFALWTKLAGAELAEKLRAQTCPLCVMPVGSVAAPHWGAAGVCQTRASMFSHTVSTVKEILPSHVSLQGLGHECQQRLGQPTPSNKRCLQLKHSKFLKKKKEVYFKQTGTTRGLYLLSWSQQNKLRQVGLTTLRVNRCYCCSFISKSTRTPSHTSVGNTWDS